MQQSSAMQIQVANGHNSMMGHTIKKHYVYLYKSPEDGAPVYVGKGWGDRAWSHVEIAERNPEQHRNKYFARTLAKWLREGHKIEPQIVQIFETHEAALELEIELIRKYGRHNTKTGTLLNLTDVRPCLKPMPTAAWINPPLEEQKTVETTQPCTVNL